MSKIEKIIHDLFLMARDKERVSNAKITAAIVYKGRVIAYGYNQYRTSWVQRRFKRNEHSHYSHAETDAVKNALKCTDIDTISKSTLIIVRAKEVNGKNVFGNAKPCSGCQECIKWMGIKKVIYTTDEGKYEQLR